VVVGSSTQWSSVLACLFSCPADLSPKDAYKVHADTNFDEPANWAAGETAIYAGDRPIPRTVSFRPEAAPAVRPVTALLPQAVFAMHALLLDVGVTLALRPGAALALAPPARTVAAHARFLAGQRESQACDLGCARNFVLGSPADAANFSAATAASLPPASAAPCSRDTVLFPPRYASKVYAGSVYDWAALALARTTATASAGLLRFVPPRPRLRLNTTAACVAEGLFDAGVDACLCPDSCSAPAAAATTTRLADAAATRAAVVLEADDTPCAVPIALTFELGEHPLGALLACFAAAPTAPAALVPTDAFLQAVLALPGILPSNASTLALEVDGAAGRVVVYGNVSVRTRMAATQAMTVTLRVHPADSVQADPPAVLANRTDLALDVLRVLTRALHGSCSVDAVWGSCAAPFAGATCPDILSVSAPVACSTLAAPLLAASSPPWAAAQTLANLLALEANMTSPLHWSLMGCADDNDNSTCVAAAVAQLQESLRAHTNGSLVALNASIAPHLAALTLACAAIDYNLTAGTRAPTTPAVLHGWLGGVLSQPHILRLVDARNAAALATWLAEGLSGFARVLPVSPASVLTALRVGNPCSEAPSQVALNNAADLNAADLNAMPLPPVDESLNLYGRATRLLRLDLPVTLRGVTPLQPSEETALVERVEAVLAAFVPATESCLVLFSAPAAPSAPSAPSQVASEAGWDRACLLTSTNLTASPNRFSLGLMLSLL
jgi:hypothetical protein